LRSHPHLKAYLALAAVCIFWGTTYLGIRMALESFPPFLLVAMRFTISGTVMLAGAAALRLKLPAGRELWQTAANGILILGIGNTCLAVAEQWIPSGLAALFITTSPFWMVGVEALIPGGEPLHAPTIAGMALGFSGVAILVSSSGLGGGAAILSGVLVLQLSCAGWSLGSIAQRRTSTTAHPMVGGAVQQLATGLVSIVPALLLKGHPVHWSARGVGALLYLVVFGSIVGYSAYIYALTNLPVAIVSIYSYINPVVAVILGWVFYRESFEGREALAMAVIFLGVGTVKRYSRKQPRLFATAAGRHGR
jgi:drug/metabolite transporter (DMT)-like permease